MDAATIVGAGLDAMAEVGFDKLSMRSVATRLGVQVGGLYYYVPDKSALLRGMADAICLDVGERLDAAPASGDWKVRATALCTCLCDTLLERRDAARVLAAGPLNASLGALELMERLITVLDAGLTPRRANLAADALMSYVTGYALQQQMPVATTGFDLAELAARFPRIMRGTHLDEKTLFRAAVRSILDGVTAR